MVVNEGVKVKTCSGVEGTIIGKVFREDLALKGWYYYVEDSNDETVMPFHENLISEVLG